jgi:hypothetical protein
MASFWGRAVPEVRMVIKTCFLAFVLAGLSLAQSSTTLFDDVKIYYQRPNETNFRDDRGVLALNGAQKVMMLLHENRPLFVMRYENITSMSFDEKRSKTLTIKYGGDSAAAGYVRLELTGKWRDILETIRTQSGQQIQMVVSK